MDKPLGSKYHFAIIGSPAVNNLTHILFPVCWGSLQGKFLERGFLGQRNEYVVFFLDFATFPPIGPVPFCYSYEQCMSAFSSQPSQALNTC